MTRTLAATSLFLAGAAFLVGCPPSEGTEDFTSGNFNFETVAVQDDCFDGGFEVIFMPDGPETPFEFGASITVPAEADLPSDQTIGLREPFGDTEVTITGDTDSRTITGAQKVDVELDADDYPGCLVDMEIDVSLTIVDADNVTGTATLNTSSFDEENCPAVTADPCDITLDIQGTRSN